MTTIKKRKTKKFRTDYSRVFKPEMPIEQAIPILQAEEKLRRDTNPGKVDTVPLNKIRRMIAIFQPRNTKEYQREESMLMDELIEAIGTRGTPKLFEDKLLVWWSGKDWYVVDGHHRLLAYRIASVDPSTPIPVDVFDGTLAQAMGESTRVNSRNKLPMSERSRMDRAWTLTVHLFHDITKPRLAAACSVSERTVGNMREAKGVIEARGRELPASWAEAKALWKGYAWNETEREDQLQHNANRIKSELIGPLALLIAKDPEALALALAQWSPPIPSRLVESEAWSFLNEDDDEERDEQDVQKGTQDF
jgi:hypothetical protein